MMNLGDVAILNICGVDYCCINRINKSKPINLWKNPDLSEKVEDKIYELFSVWRRNKETITFVDTEIKDCKIHR